MKIRKLQIQNQKVFGKQIKLEFGPGTSMILGKGQSGKTTIYKLLEEIVNKNLINIYSSNVTRNNPIFKRQSFKFEKNLNNQKGISSVNIEFEFTKNDADNLAKVNKFSSQFPYLIKKIINKEFKFIKFNYEEFKNIGLKVGDSINYNIVDDKEVIAQKDNLFIKYLKHCGLFRILLKNINVTLNPLFVWIAEGDKIDLEKYGDCDLLVLDRPFDAGLNQSNKRDLMAQMFECQRKFGNQIIATVRDRNSEVIGPSIGVNWLFLEDRQ